MARTTQAKVLTPGLARRIRHTAKAQASIARLAGVTRGQVWKVVHRHRRASPELRDAIRRFFESLRTAKPQGP